MSFHGGTGATLDALDEALGAQERAAAKGFDWPDVDGPLRKISEEICELQEAIARRDAREMHEETGDILFSVVNVCRFTRVSPTTALRDATERFVSRVSAVEKLMHARGRTMESCSLDELDAAWEEIKRHARQTLEQRVDK